MFKSIIVALICFLSFSLQVQAQEGFQEGEAFTLEAPLSKTGYKYIHFPRKNIIVKRGGIPDMKSVEGVKVIVSKLETNSRGQTVALLRRADGGKFFRSLPTVKTQLESALEAGELSR